MKNELLGKLAELKQSIIDLENSYKKAKADMTPKIDMLKVR